MADFYEEMAQMAKDMLSPTSAGGLGQGSVELLRKTSIPAQDSWAPPSMVVQSETLNAAVKIIPSRLSASASFVDGLSVLEGDIMATASVPEVIDWIPGGDSGSSLYLRVDGGIEMPVESVTTIPEAGTPVAIVIIARGPKRG